jgi:hypothetical protein
MNSAMKRLAERFDRFLAGSTHADRSRYLAQANDAADLERRIRELERRPARQAGYY